MADQVTISTFLELRDNLSEGMRKAAAAVEATVGRVRRARTEEEKAEKEQQRNKLRALNELRKYTNRQEREKEQEDRRQVQRAKLIAKEAADAAKARDAQSRQENQTRVQSALRAEKERERAVVRAQKEMLRASQASADFRRKLEINSAKRASAEAAREFRAQQREFRAQQREKVRIAEERVRTAQRALAEIQKAHAAIILSEARATRAQIQEIKRVDRARAEAHRHHMRGLRAREETSEKKKGGLFGTILSANLASDFITRGIPRAFGALKDHFKTVAKEGQEYEDSVNRIALTMAGLNVAPSMRASTREAEGLFNIMRDMAAKLPGETQDYIQVFAQGLPDALTAGMTDTKKFADFVSKYTAIAITRGVGSARAATDLEQILEGRARVTTRTYAELRPYIGMLSREFNKLTPVERFERLQRAVAQASTGIAAVAESANAKFGEMESHIKEIYTIGEKPLFDAIKSVVSDLNALFVKNRKEILDTAKAVSTTLGDAFRGIVPIVGDIGMRFTRLMDDMNSSPILRSILNFLSFQALDIGQTGRRLGEATREHEERTAALEIMRKYETLIPGTRGLVPEEMDQYLMELWMRRAGTKGAAADAIQSKEDWDAFVTAVTANADKAQELWKNMIASGDVKTTKMPHTAEAPAERARNYNDFRHSNFNIKQEFAEGFDPDRIAFAFASDLSRLGEMKLQAAYSLTGGSVR